MKTILKPTITVLIAIISLSINAQVAKPMNTIPKKSNPKLAQAITTSKQEKIRLEDINEWLCPKTLVRGDREFDGHGPRVKCEVKIRLAANGKEIWADITLWAQETVHDWSTTEGKWSKKVYDAPYGKTINKIISETASRTEFISQPAGFQFIIPGSDVQAGLTSFLDGQTISRNVLNAHGVPKEFTDVVGAPLHLSQDIIKNLVGTYVNGNTIYKVPPLEGTLVYFFHIVGDTGGDDISNDDNCNDDTRIEKIQFDSVIVEFK